MGEYIMPKQMTFFKEDDNTNKNSRLLGSYFNFIDSNYASEEFTYDDLIEWIENEFGGSKNIKFIVAMLVKAWIKADYVIDNRDNTFTPIYFEDDDQMFKFKNIDDEELGRPDLDDEYLKDYGNKDVRFPRINDSFDEGKKLNKKKMVKESKVDYNSLSYDDLLDILVDMIVDGIDGIEDKTYEEYIDIIDDYFFSNLVIPIADKLSGRFAGVPSEYWKWTKEQSKNESKKPAKNERRTIIEKYVKA